MKRRRSSRVQGSDSGESKKIDILRRLVAIEPIDTNGISSAVKGLRSAVRALAGFAGTNAERSRKRADILERAIALHEKHNE